MNKISSRFAKSTDTQKILALFLQQFPFLKAHPEKVIADIQFRIDQENAVTLVSESDDKILAVARAYEQNGVYLLNSICTAGDLGLLERCRVLMSLLPLYIDLCGKTASALGYTEAFFGTDLPALERLVRYFCKVRGFTIEKGPHEGRVGYWIKTSQVQQS